MEGRIGSGSISIVDDRRLRLKDAVIKGDIVIPSEYGEIVIPAIRENLDLVDVGIVARWLRESPDVRVTVSSEMQPLAVAFDAGVSFLQHTTKKIRDTVKYGASFNPFFMADGLCLSDNQPGRTVAGNLGLKKIMYQKRTAASHIKYHHLFSIRVSCCSWCIARLFAPDALLPKW